MAFHGGFPTTRARLRSRFRSPLRSLGRVACGILLATSASGAAGAAPILRLQSVPLGGGLTRYDVEVDFRDGLGRSGFLQVAFQGPFDAQSQLFTANWPDLQEVQTGGNTYVLQGGTGGGSSVDVVGVGQLVVPDGERWSYSAVISRNGQNTVVVPEPGPRLLALATFAALAGLVRRGARAPSRTLTS
jgi:hypothetical protein